MIKSFVDKATEKFFETSKSRQLPPAIMTRAAMRLNQLDSALAIEDFH